jgi:hypothetical protein
VSSTWLCFSVPLYAVWAVGGCLAIARWRRHPRVSLLVLLSIGAMLVAAVGMQVSVWFISRAMSGPSFGSLAPYLAVLGLAHMLLRTTAWVAILTAIFGWRSSGLARPQTFQFSIRGLLILTLAVAVLCAVGRVVVSWLGGVSPYWVSLADDLPVSICWFCGGWLAISRRSEHPIVSSLALVAIALSAASFLSFHLVWISNLSSGTAYLVQWASLVSGLIAPIVWALLLAAALGWRSEPAATAPAQSASAPTPGP